MNNAILTSYERSDTPNRIRQSGFTPAVIYGHGYEEGKAVQFKTSQVLSVMRSHGANARVYVELDEKKEYGAIKEVQTDVLTNQIKHLDIQVFSQDDVVRLTVPIYYTGMEALTAQRLVVSTLISELEITGEASQIPQSITVDLENKEAGDTVTVEDLKLDENLKTSVDITETLVTIAMGQVEVEEDADESAGAEESDEDSTSEE